MHTTLRSAGPLPERVRPPSVASSASSAVYGMEKANVHLMEAGPRFELKLYQIKLGTLEQTEVDNEWVLRPYQNSAKRRKVMGE